jgi:hypothetical protein
MALPKLSYIVNVNASIIWGFSKLLLFGATPFSLYLKTAEPLLITNVYKSFASNELYIIREAVPKYTSFL